MNIHPLVLSALVVDALGMLGIAAAVPAAAQVMVSWKPGDASRAQLTLERRAESGSAWARMGLVLHAAGLLMTLVAINHVLPHIVPGAMCGFGAVQAMPDGRLMLVLRVVSVLALVGWWEMDRADRATPVGVLAQGAARALLVAAPIAAVSTWQTAMSLLHVDVQTPVSCCAAVFDLGGGPIRTGSIPVAGNGVVALTLAGGAALIVAALWGRRGGLRAWPTRWASLAVAGAAAWTVVAGWALVDVSGPYVFGVLGHRCPFCLMLPSHGAVGYVGYGAMAVVLIDTLRAAVASAVGVRRHASRSLAERTVRRSLTRVALATIVFLATAFLPVLWWRAREGVWISG